MHVSHSQDEVLLHCATFANVSTFHSSQQDHAGRLDDSKWFESLMFYAFRVGDDNVTSADHDVTLVPTLIEKVIISKLTRKFQSSDFVFHRN